MATKKVLEYNLSKVAGVSVEITFARTNMVTIAWDNKDDSAFNRTLKVSYLIMNTMKNVICLFVV